MRRCDHRVIRRAAAPIAVLMAGLSLSACATPPDAASSSGTNRPANQATDRTQASAHATTGSGRDASQTPPGRIPGSRPPATYTNAAPAPVPLVQRAPAQARAFMRAYARPAGIGPASFGWWSTVKPYLSARGRNALKRKPMSVPFTQVTGPALHPRMGTTHGMPCARVTIPTDHGMWVVTVVTNKFDQLLIDGAKPAH